MIFYLFLFIFGTAIGSFLNVIIDRWPHNQSIQGRSHCDYCQHKLAWNDLIPIFSFFLLRGRCRYCQKKLSFFYPFVEFITGVMFVTAWIYLPVSLFTYKIAYLGIVSCLIAIFFADAKYHIIPDQLPIALLIFSLIILPISGFVPQIFIGRVIAAFIVMAPILFLYWITRGGGMGFGDVKLAFAIGFLLGGKLGLISLYLAFILGALVGILMLLLKKRSLRSKIAFGPFIVLGALIVLFFQSSIMAIIAKIYGL